MKEYLKMSDGFYDLDIGFLEQRLFSGLVSKEECTYAANAINSHDELVAEVERLRNHVNSLKYLAAHFAECGGWDVEAYQEYVNANVE